MKKLMSFLIVLLTIGLLVSAMSCGEDDIDYIYHTELHYVNETGVKPIQLDFYCGQERKISVSINSNDTTFDATENNNYGWMIPASNDSIIVKFGEKPSKTYREDEYVESIKNPCRSECYEKETITNTKKRYTFTFTKDMLE